jgi:hypothetical protein
MKDIQTNNYTIRPEMHSIPSIGKEIFCAPQALESTKSTVQWALEHPAHEADHSPLSRGEAKNAWSYTSTLSLIFLPW